MTTMEELSQANDRVFERTLGLRVMLTSQAVRSSNLLVAGPCPWHFMRRVVNTSNVSHAEELMAFGAEKLQAPPNFFVAAFVARLFFVLPLLEALLS